MCRHIIGQLCREMGQDGDGQDCQIDRIAGIDRIAEMERIAGIDSIAGMGMGRGIARMGMSFFLKKHDFMFSSATSVV